jgi:hypothetical protein
MGPGISKEECLEVLEYFRDNIINTPDEWLQKLSENYALDAFLCVDPEDFVNLLSQAGKKHLLSMVISDKDDGAKCVKQIFEKAKSLGADPAFSVNIILVVKVSNSLSLLSRVAGSMMNELLISKHIDAEWLMAIYFDPSMVEVMSLTLMLSGIDELLPEQGV